MRLHRATLFALFGAYLFGFGQIVYWSSQQAPRQQITQTASSEHGGGKQNHKSLEWGHSDPGVTLATVALVLIAVVQAVMFFVQLRYMRIGVNDAADAAQAANASAQATREAVTLAKDTAKRQLRAYVHVSEARFSDFGFPGGIYLVNYTNTGQTPAYDVYSSIALQFAKFPLAEELVATGTGTKGIITLGRDGEGHARLEAPRGLSGEEYGEVRDGKSAVFVFGTISYRDAFGEDWTTDFRYYVGGDQGIRGDGFMAGHSEGNKAT